MQRPYGLARKREVPPHGRRKACKETNQSAMEEKDWFECFSCKASGNEHGTICSSRARDRAGSSIDAKSRARAFAFFRSSVKFVVAKRQFLNPQTSIYVHLLERRSRKTSLLSFGGKLRIPSYRSIAMLQTFPLSALSFAVPCTRRRSEPYFLASSFLIGSKSCSLSFTSGGGCGL